MRNRILKYTSIITLGLCCAALAFAAGEKQRMIERMPQIKALKAAGVVGEKANGLLGFVKKSSEDQALVDAENKDRKTVYVVIAKRQGSTASNVAVRRALTLAKKAASGQWVQGADGKWVQK